MDEQIIPAITNAMDGVLRTVAEKEFRRLRRRKSAEEIAAKIHSALQSQKDLMKNVMPKYDDWDALMYILWYQPKRINLAYTLSKQLLKRDADQIQEAGALEVYDFGCGALAMKFGLALAVADQWPEGENSPTISVISEDSSKPMKSIGERLWETFLESLNLRQRIAGLGRYREACMQMQDEPLGASSSVRWLTVLHVAYQEAFTEVQRELDERVKKDKPGTILVTAHTLAREWVYAPSASGYTGATETIGKPDLDICGDFMRTTKYRRHLYWEYIKESNLDADAIELSRAYLMNSRTIWEESVQFESLVTKYRRK